MVPTAWTYSSQFELQCIVLSEQRTSYLMTSFLELLLGYKSLPSLFCYARWSSSWMWRETLLTIFAHRDLQCVFINLLHFLVWAGHLFISSFMMHRVHQSHCEHSCVPLLWTATFDGQKRTDSLIAIYEEAHLTTGGLVAEWLACWTQAQKGLGWNHSRDAVGNSLRQTVYTHCASVHQAAKLVAALLSVAGVTAGLAESNGSLPPGLWLTSPAGWLRRTGISSGTLHSVIEYELPLHPTTGHCRTLHQWQSRKEEIQIKLTTWLHIYFVTLYSEYCCWLERVLMMLCWYCRRLGDGRAWYIWHNAVCVAAGGHVVCGPGSQHGLTAVDCWQSRHASLAAQLSHHDPPALRTRRRKLSTALL